MSFIFPGQNPPMLKSGANVDQACTWLLAVMDDSDRSRKFIASILTYYLDRGYISEKQMDSLRNVTSKIISKYLEGELESQGCAPAKDQTLDFGNVIELRRASDDGRVLE